MNLNTWIIRSDNLGKSYLYAVSSNVPTNNNRKKKIPKKTDNDL